MNYRNRLGLVGSSSPGGFPAGAGGQLMQPQTTSAGFQTNFGVQGNATGPAFVLVAIVGLLLLDYVWTRGQQGGR